MRQACLRVGQGAPVAPATYHDKAIAFALIEGSNTLIECGSSLFASMVLSGCRISAITRFKGTAHGSAISVADSPGRTNS
jgi:hypothetical protein